MELTRLHECSNCQSTSFTKNIKVVNRKMEQNIGTDIYVCSEQELDLQIELGENRLDNKYKVSARMCDTCGKLDFFAKINRE